MICTSRLIFIVTYFGLVFVTTAIPKQEKTSLWNVYEYEGSYSGDKRGFYIAYWELTEEDLKEVNVQMLLNGIMEINYVNNVRNSGIDWEWEFTTENGTVWANRGRFEHHGGQIGNPKSYDTCLCLHFFGNNLELLSLLPFGNLVMLSTKQSY